MTPLSRLPARLGKKARAAKILFICALLVPAAAGAQYPFGKNKVIYSNKDWKVLQTEHVDIYHYPNEANLIKYVAPLVEETFLEYSALFKIEFSRRLPFVFYSSHYDFQQTNILPYLISEYTGGFTDLIKGRIAVPFTGSYGIFRHVVRHEMVHAFMLEKINQVMSNHGKFTYAHPPLWFVEGLAEYLATSPQDTQSHMFIRDALVNNRLLDLENIWRITGSFMMYKEGEAVVSFIARSFGEEAVIQILENWWMSERFPLVLKKTINMDLAELNDAFMKYVKRRYYPAVLHRGFASDVGEQLTPPYSFHNRAAVTRGPDGEVAIYSLCAQDGVINVCRIYPYERGGKTVREKTRRKLIAKGSRSAALESIPAFRSKIEAHGDTLLFVSRSMERDVIYMWDASRKKEIASFSFGGLGVLSSPTLSGDRSKLVFSAIDSTGVMDLFLYELVPGRLTRLTHDGFSDEDPDFHPFEDVILFTSDRNGGRSKYHTGIFRLELDTGTISAATDGRFSDGYAEWAPDGRSFLFVSDRDGVFDVYERRGNVVTRQTNVLGGVTGPAFVPGGREFVGSVYTGGEFQLFRFPVVNKGGVPALAAVESENNEAWDNAYEGRFEFVTRDYKMKLGVDFVGVGIAIDPDYGEVGNGGQIVLTDILGNHQFYFFFGNTSEGFDDFWQRINAGFSYVNLSHRLNYAVGLFHLNNLSSRLFSLELRERRYGGTVAVSYPLNKFQRLESSVVLRHLERESGYWGIGLDTKSSILGSTFLTFVSDNTLWTIGGPIVGTRFYVTGGQTVDFLGRGFANTSLHVDFRQYIKLTNRTLFAGRFLTRNSWGSDEHLLYLGGPWDLRGYEFREFFGHSIYLFNNELRFPLLDGFVLRFPFGTVELPMFRGAILFDVGRATRFIADTGWLGSFGAGVELNLGYAPVIRVNFTRATDFSSITDDTKFGLFIGYNY